MTEYIFTTDWFSYNIHNWNICLDKFKNKQNLSFMEIGSFQGRSAIWLLENVLTDNSSKLYCVDTFEGSEEHDDITKKDLYNIFCHNINNFKEKVVICRGKSNEMLKKFDNNTFDMIYVDGSHFGKDVLYDIVLSYSLLKKDGIMIIDDYLWEDPPFTDGLKLAVDSFIEIYKNELEILNIGYQVYFKKIRE